ncbi:hypothetical protein [Nocardioides sp. NPDC006273]|uniref:hypothetical protein n=1 Tax=Nocardioides sp. NPDC006273 TaxID=3155598 RepID=UPI00339F4828
MRGTGRVMRAGIKKIWGPGRYETGNNAFTYFLGPSGSTMEYTTELEPRPSSSPDRGVFVAPLSRIVPDLFEPFRRLAERTNTPGEGSGLGLAIVASIARAHAPQPPHTRTKAAGSL